MKKSKRNYVRGRSKPGDVVLHCGHLRGKRDHVNLSWMETPVVFSGSDGVTEEPQYLIECERCFDDRVKRSFSRRIRDGAVWRGEEADMDTLWRSSYVRNSQNVAEAPET